MLTDFIASLTCQGCGATANEHCTCNGPAPDPEPVTIVQTSNRRPKAYVDRSAGRYQVYYYIDGRRRLALDTFSYGEVENYAERNQLEILEIF